MVLYRRSIFVLTLLMFAIFTVSCQQETAPLTNQGTQKFVEVTTLLPQFNEPVTVMAEVVDDLLIWGGDMLLGRVSELSAEGFGVNKVTYESALWPNNIVFYSISNTFSNARKEVILQTINHWKTKTNLDFVERTNQEYYVEFIPSDGCWSYVGYNGRGKQQIGLEDSCSFGAILHEIGHTIGFMHEHQRSDRDTYIKIQEENIISGGTDYNRNGRDDLIESNFDIPTRLLSIYKNLTPYDYDSVMHYRAYAGSKNGQPTIVPKNGVSLERIGPSDELSHFDIQAANALYPNTSISKPVRVQTSSPGTTSPTGGGSTIGTLLQPQLSWQAVSNADSYSVQIHQGTTTIYSVKNIKSVSQVVPTNTLNQNKNYSWRAQACNATGCGEWSVYLYFHTEAPQTPLIPELTSPGIPSGVSLDGGEVGEINTTTPALHWQSVSDANNYKIQIYQGSTIVYSKENIASTSITVPAGRLQQGKTYNWRASACNDSDCSEWSSYLYFKVQKAPEPEPEGSISVLATQVSNTNVKIQWPGSADSYQMYYSLGSDFSTAKLIVRSFSKNEITFRLPISWDGLTFCVWIQPRKDGILSDPYDPGCVNFQYGAVTASILSVQDLEEDLVILAPPQ